MIPMNEQDREKIHKQLDFLYLSTWCGTVSGYSCFNIQLDKTFGISYFSECLFIKLWQQRCHNFPFFSGLYRQTSESS